MKTFISTISILILSFFASNSNSSSQGVTIGLYTISTYDQTEMLIRYFLSRVNLTHNEVHLLSLNNDIEECKLLLEKQKIIHPTRLSDIINDSLNEINIKTNY